MRHLKVLATAFVAAALAAAPAAANPGHDGSRNQPVPQHHKQKKHTGSGTQHRAGPADHRGAPGPAGRAGTPEPRKPLSQADREFVDATVEEAMREEHQPGMEISITGPRGSYTRTYGVSSLETGKPLTRADHFRVGSITKTFTATAILREVEKGNLQLSDTLDTWVSGIPNGSLITVRDLLSMQSGVFEYEADPTLSAEFDANPLMRIEPEDLVEIIRDNPPYFAPGTARLYENSNYVLLGVILEDVTGETAEAAIAKDVIEPLGLHHTSFPNGTPTLPTPFTQGYNLGEGGALRNSTEFNPNVFWTAGAIVSTLSDLSKWGRALGTGALLSPEMWEERQQFCPLPYAFEGPTEFGYGLGLISFGSWLGHDGSVPGSSTETMYEPKTGAEITGMENLQTPPLSIFSRVFERIAAHLYPGSMETPEYPVC
jgi:D-alanyl-D-alanine carboxypeptidase